jgi:hypothetical protein
MIKNKFLFIFLTIFIMFYSKENSIENSIRAFEDDILAFENDILAFENNIVQLRLLVLFIENETFTNSIEKKINITNKQLSSNELIHYIQNIKELKDYKLQYLLNFTIEKSPRELYELFNNPNVNNTYNLTSITNSTFENLNIEQNKYSKNVCFTTMNTLIIVANKNNKYYIKRNSILTKHNTSRKNIKS